MMITERSPEEFFKVAHLLDGDRTNLEVKASPEYEFPFPESVNHNG